MRLPKKVSAATDDASEENIKQLLETTEAFIKSDNYREGKSVTSVISEFIKNNFTPELIRPYINSLNLFMMVRNF